MAEGNDTDPCVYSIRRTGHGDIRVELDAGRPFGPEVWVRIIKGFLKASDFEVAKHLITSQLEELHHLNDLLLSASEFGCGENCPEVIELLLQKGAEINAVTYGTTALYVAANNEDNMPTVKLLLKRSADPNVLTDSGLALNKAIQRQDRKLVEALLKYGASVNVEDHSSLHWAIQSKDWDITRRILSKKPTDTDVGRSLSYDCVAGIDKLLKLSKKSGLKATVFPGDTKNCMYKAIRDDNVLELTRLLKNRDVKVVSVGDRLTPLHVATFYKRETVAEVLLSCGADAFAKDCCGDTPVDYVIKNKNFSVLQVFLRMGTRFNEHSEMFLRATMYELPDFIERMVEYGADVNVKDERGYTALHIAVKNDDKSCVRKLLEAGADPNYAATKDGIALHLVKEFTSHAVAKLLLDYGSDINIVCGKNKTSFEKWAVQRNRTLGIMLGHFLKLRTAQMFLNRANNDCWDDGWYRHWGDETFATKCEREIDMMKNERVDGLGLYDILTASENRLAALCKNERIQMFVNSVKLDKYNMYGELIKGRLNLGKIRRTCLERSRMFFDHLDPSLPSICVDNILSYLGNQDLRMLEKVRTDIENPL